MFTKVLKGIHIWYLWNLEFVALLDHLTIVRIFANNLDLFKVLLSHCAIIKILANSSNF